MIVQLFGLVDLIAAALIYFGDIRGPSFIITSCITLLLAKGIMSLYPIPFYLPGFLMNITDMIAVLLLYFGTTPFPEAKAVVIAVLVVKAAPSLVSSIFLAIGMISARRK